ncbi:hypothetical protein [Microbacterium sp. 179-I 3D4 NHS]|uniref:hypothetical protein n=1 Tax=Microbacterium sp. 179-I 3D4 NHS TaxID=3142381 RepID=UPI0039A09384
MKEVHVQSERELSNGYDVTIWGRRALVEPLSQLVGEVPARADGLGWLQILVDLIEQQGLRWREHVDPASGYPFLPHEDGMPPVPLSDLRATQVDMMLGHSPFADRSNLSLKFLGTGAVVMLLEVFAGRVPGIDVTIRMATADDRYEWRYNAGELSGSEVRAVLPHERPPAGAGISEI